jgi:maleate isomerase
MECEFASHLPNGVSLHTARLPLREVTIEGLAEMDVAIRVGAQALGDAGVDVIVYGCTTGSLIFGAKHASAIAEEIESLSLPAVVTAKAVVDSINENGGQRIVVATPYLAELNQKEKEFLEANGLEVLAIEGLGLKDNLEIGRQDPHVAYRLGRRMLAQNPRADLLFISCTNFRTFGIINVLSADTRKPVITSNQATLTHALRALNISDSEIEKVLATL